MVPSESCILRGRRTGRPLIALLVVVLGVNFPSPARAQESQPEGEPSPLGNSAPLQTSGIARPEPSSSTIAVPTAPVPASTARSILDAVRAAASRQLVPFDPSRDPRLRSLDTSFPAEQPEIVEPQVEPEVPYNGSRAPARRTLLRTVGGVTVLTNVDEPLEESVPTPRAERLASNGSVSRGSTASVPHELRQVSANVNALEPTGRRPQTAAFPLWLWGLAGLAVVLLVPIAVLLTRPVRKQ